jgi:hypothetical protein
MMQVLILLFKLNYFSSAVGKIIIKNFIALNVWCYEQVCVAPAANLLIARVI